MSDLELDRGTHDEITALCQEGDLSAEDGRLEDALGAYTKALELLPEPASQWEAATWIYAAIGDVHFLIGSFEISQMAFEEALTCPGSDGNAFLHLRLGQLALEHEDEARAAEELGRAFSAEGEEIFATDDPKYLAFLKTRLASPPE